MPLSGSRTEFLAADALGPAGDIQYGRTGGWFVTTRKALVLGVAVVLSLVIVGVLVHYLDTCKKGKSEPIANATSESSSSSQSSTTSPGVTNVTTETPAHSTITPAPEVNYRLPKSVIPQYYNIWVQPYIGEQSSSFTFKGRVAIVLSCNQQEKECPKITLHAKDLDVAFGEVSVMVEDADRSRSQRAAPKKFGGAQKQENATAPLLKVTGHSVDRDKDMITFNVEPALQPGTNYSMVISFLGNLTKGLTGFYLSSYNDTDGMKKWLATTHFEATHARQAFPCFDEPAFKAQFEMHIARPDNMTSVSNMPIKSSESASGQPGWKWDHYLPSPIMSTYLVAYTVSEFGAVNTTTGGEGKPAVSVLARPEMLPQAQYALDIGPRILEYYTNYFGQPYPLPKLDMAAIPDFSAGAMENWGLVTYRESRILYSPNTSTTGSKQSVAIVVAHELAHQWFGNLVTMDWWSDLWLNEGFATYVSYIGTHHVEPTWEMLDRILTHQLQPVLDTDSLMSTHPISGPVNNPGQIAEVFDDVSYNKGASLIRMLNHSLTEPVFRAGLVEYLSTWRYMNAKQDDLWTSLTAAAQNSSSSLLPKGKTIKDVMDTWTLKEGYPVVIVTRDYAKGSMQLTQRRFQLEESSSPSKHFAHWIVPVSFTTKDEMRPDNTRARVWMTEINLRVENVTKPGSDAWLLINLQQTGYYRVNYDPTNWQLIIKHLNSAPVDSLPATTRAQLINDAMNLARAGLLPYGVALNLTRYLPGREHNLLPWSAFFNGISVLNAVLRNTRAYGDLQDFIVDQSLPIFKSLGEHVRENDTQPQRLLRSSVIGRLLRAESPKQIEWMRTLFAKWMDSSDPDTTNPIEVDLRGDIYCAAIRAGGNREWRFVMQRFQAANTNPSEAENLLRSLMCTRNTWLISSLLEQSLDEGSSIRLQDSFIVWRAIAQNPVAASMAFGYVRARWPDIYNKYSKIGFVQRAVIKGSTAGLSTEQDLKDLLAFKEAHEGQFNLTTRTLAQCIEKLQLKVLWQKKYSTVVTNWLRAYRKTVAA